MSWGDVESVRLTRARRRGLAIVAAVDGPPVRRSNATDELLGRLYWQTADWLVEHGLAYYPSGSDLLLPTGKGSELALAEGLL